MRHNMKVRAKLFSTLYQAVLPHSYKNGLLKVDTIIYFPISLITVSAIPLNLIFQAKSLAFDVKPPFLASACFSSLLSSFAFKYLVLQQLGWMLLPKISVPFCMFPLPEKTIHLTTRKHKSLSILHASAQGLPLRSSPCS